MLREKFKNHQIILASQSPRRKELMQGLDIDFVTQPLHADESYDSTLKGKDITEYLCRKKAEAYQSWQPNDILITADTIVWHNNLALEKPKNDTDAIAMLLELQNNTHTVITSVGIFSLDKKLIFSDTTLVTFAELTKEEINYYVRQYSPLDKAGAYGVQDWIGFIGVKKIEGSYYTVMGLPTYKLYQALKNY